jgi:hypothetical protein
MNKIMDKLSNDMRILDVPKKFPDAYKRSISELERRKLFG